MKKLLGAAVLLSGCGLLALVPSAQPPCYGPPHDFQGVPLAQCQKNDKFLACAYVFVDNGRLCYHVLAQPVDDCSTPFSYMTTECVDPEQPEEKQQHGQDTTQDESWSVLT